MIEEKKINFYCDFHNNSLIKYYCIRTECNQKVRAACAYCIAEEPHKFHEYKKITEFLPSLIDAHNKIYKVIHNCVDNKIV